MRWRRSEGRGSGFDDGLKTVISGAEVAFGGVGVNGSDGDGDGLKTVISGAEVACGGVGVKAAMRLFMQIYVICFTKISSG